jgi:hypothetical protein
MLFIYKTLRDYVMAQALIVEDDLMIADSIQEVSPRGGHEVCGIARTMERRLTLKRWGSFRILYATGKSTLS